MGIISHLESIELTQPVSYWMSETIVVQLWQNSHNYKSGCIRFHLTRQSRVKVLEKRPHNEALLQFFEDDLNVICPYKRSAFLTLFEIFGEVEKSGGYLWVGVDEPLIEVHKTQKRLNFFDVSWHWSLKDGGNLFRFHFNLIGVYYKTKERDFVCHEPALASLAKQLNMAKVVQNLLNMYLVFLLIV